MLGYGVSMRVQVPFTAQDELTFDDLGDKLHELVGGLDVRFDTVDDVGTFEFTSSDANDLVTLARRLRLREISMQVVRR